MLNIILTLNGDYTSYIKWDQKFEYNEILKEYGIILITAVNHRVKVMDNYKVRWMYVGERDVNLEELKEKLGKNIRDFLKTHPELKEFTLDRIEIL